MRTQVRMGIFVSLESHDVRAFATEDPRGFLAQYAAGAILDEIQRAPHLPSYLQTLVEILLTGFYPRIHDCGLDPVRALADYFETYVERDLRQLIHLRDLSLFNKFVKLCAGRVGQLCNLQGLASDTGISHTTARAWMSLLEGT